MTKNLEEVKKDLLAQIEKRVNDKIIEPTNAAILNKLIKRAEDETEAIAIATLGTTYKRTGFHFDKRLEKTDDTIKYFKKNEELSLQTSSDAITHKLIIGDNYQALQNLLIEYKNKIDVIYIDPPYGKDSMGEFADTNYDNSLTRDNLLSMLYPRLILAKQLLSNDGVIFCSIDDKNQAYVKCLFDEIFEESNFIGSIARVSKKGGNKGNLLKPKKDYILVYAKNTSSIDQSKYGKFNIIEEPKWIEEDFNGEKRLYVDNGTPYRAKLEVRPNQRYFIECPDGSLIIPPGNVFPHIKKDGEMIKPESEQDKCWTWSRDRYIKEKEIGRFIFKKTDKSSFLDQDGKPSSWTISKKKFKTEFIDAIDDEDAELSRKEILSDYLDRFPTSKGTKDLNALGLDFDYPKPVELIKYLIEIVENNKDTKILDFFAGSGTTGQAVLELNKKDGGNRQFILAQLNEITKTTPNGIVYDVLSKRLKRIMTGECYDGTKDFEWITKNKPLGDNLDVYDIASVSNASNIKDKTPFDVIDETLYGNKKFKTVKEKIEWVINNFEQTQRYLDGEE